MFIGKDDNAEHYKPLMQKVIKIFLYQKTNMKTPLFFRKKRKFYCITFHEVYMYKKAIILYVQIFFVSIHVSLCLFDTVSVCAV